MTVKHSDGRRKTSNETHFGKQEHLEDIDKTDKAKFCKLCNDDGRTCLIVRGLFMFHISDVFSPSAVCFLENQIEIVLK